MAEQTAFTTLVKPYSIPKSMYSPHSQGLQFGLLSARQIQRLAVIKITDRQLYIQPEKGQNQGQGASQLPVQGGPLDPHLGVSEKGKICATCQMNIWDCPGHMGYIRLELPVFHVGYLKHTVATLQAICKSCSRLLFKSDQSRTDFLRKIRKKQLDRNQKDSILKAILKECKRPKQCLHCKMFNGMVKKLTGTLRIVHEKFEGGQGDNLRELTDNFNYLLEKTPEFEARLTSKLHDDINPFVAYSLLEGIPEEDIELLGMDISVSHPKDLIITSLIVPPVCIRPTVQRGQGLTNEDDLTIKIMEIVQFNDLIRRMLSEGTPANKVATQWENLQGTIALYINADVSGIPQDLQGGKGIRALCQRLKGKHGRFRGNLSGKRVNFCGRTVISPDPNLQIKQVAIPRLMAKRLTFPEQVNRYNIEKLRKLVINGPDVYPGANNITFAGTGQSVYLRFGNRAEQAQSLAIGDTVERHLLDNDAVLFNRQPSLHRISIMCHRAKVMPWRTLRFNECVCTPYNADFDGDEMNLHLPQTEEAKAEASVLMNVVECIISPKAGDPIISPTQDFLTCGFLLTRKDVFFDRAAFWRLAAAVVDAAAAVEIPPPAIFRPTELWTGKQLFSLILRPSRRAAREINLETREKLYSKKGEHMCFRDGWVVIQHSQLLCGNLTKLTLGAGSKDGIVAILARDDSCQSATAFMSRLAKLTSRYLCDRGLSIGLEDVTPSETLLISKGELIEKGYHECEKIIEQWKAGKLPLKAGCDAEQTLESLMNGELGRVREKAGDVCSQQLPTWNAPLIMAVSGSKGSLLNMCQMIALLGQQTVNGHRIPDGFGNRSLPHFEVRARDPAAKGFVQNSFYSGLTSIEFFFHTMGGREGLVDTAVKTAETGYMQRRLMKALEDLSVKYDYSVRSSTGEIAQLIYGDDALEPMKMEEGMQPVSYVKLLNNARQTCRDKATALNSEHFIPVATEVLESIKGNHLPSFEEFKKRTLAFIHKIATESASLQERLQSECLHPPAHKAITADFYSSAVLETGLSNALKGIQDMSEGQLRGLLELCWRRYEHALVAPGEAVGAVAAQSIGEPGTQMTLKTFHFAGVASMNITLGVPRIKEIINAVKDISTPIITVHLLNAKEQTSARVAKGKIEKTTVKDICQGVEEVYTKTGAYLRFLMNLEAIESMMLGIKLEDIKSAILKWPKIKLQSDNFELISPNEICIHSSESAKERLYFHLQELKATLPSIIVKGVPSVKRAVISQDASTREFNLLVEGTGLEKVMITPGLDFRRCTTNHVMETEAVLGIEAARQCIINEIKYTLNEHGITVDSRHIMLLADVMTCKGMICGITRFGVSKMKESTLMLASFEMTTDHLFNAAVRGFHDGVTGVSECIIMGNRVPLGTGMFDLLMNVQSTGLRRIPEKRRSLLLS